MSIRNVAIQGAAHSRRAAALLSIFVFAACSDSSAPAPTPDGGPSGGATAHTVETLPLACTMFTRDIAAKLTKEPLGAQGKETTLGKGRYCAWASTTGNAAYSVQLTWADGGASYYDVICTRDKGQKIADVGDNACFYPSSTAGGGGLFFALAGDYTVTLTATDGTSDSLGAVVKQIIANLPAS